MTTIFRCPAQLRAPDSRRAGRTTAMSQAQTVRVPRCDFTIQFVWKETPMDKRLEALDKQKQNRAGKTACDGQSRTAGGPPAGANDECQMTNV